MNVKITVDAAHAFDMYTILSIKYANCTDPNSKIKLIEQMELLGREINEAISYEMASRIYRSDFYSNLYHANLAIFLRIKKEKSDADILNQKRFDAKQALQNAFFNKTLEEIKLD